jgi:hypothetical protein
MQLVVVTQHRVSHCLFLQRKGLEPGTIEILSMHSEIKALYCHTITRDQVTVLTPDYHTLQSCAKMFLSNPDLYFLVWVLNEIALVKTSMILIF